MSEPAEIKIGRPSGFRTEFVEQAQKLCKLGATDEDLADFFGVSIRTISGWKVEHAPFLQALKGGKDEADDRVERSLYQKAIGYTFDSVKVFQYEGTPVIVPLREHVPPDTTAAIFWLKNRRRLDWRDRHEITGADGGSLAVSVVRYDLPAQVPGDGAKVIEHVSRETSPAAHDAEAPKQAQVVEKTGGET